MKQLYNINNIEMIVIWRTGDDAHSPTQEISVGISHKRSAKSVSLQWAGHSISPSTIREKFVEEDEYPSPSRALNGEK